MSLGGYIMAVVERGGEPSRTCDSEHMRPSPAPVGARARALVRACEEPHAWPIPIRRVLGHKQITITRAAVAKVTAWPNAFFVPVPIWAWAPLKNTRGMIRSRNPLLVKPMLYPLQYGRVGNTRRFVCLRGAQSTRRSMSYFLKH